MGDLTFWLHMNDEYMWHWYCSRADGSIVVVSTRAFFVMVEAESAMQIARLAIGQTALAA